MVDRERVKEDLSCLEEIKELESPFEDHEYYPEMLIPLPEEINIEPDDLTTPFPFIVESPTLNTEIELAEVSKHLFSKIDKLSKEEEKLLYEIALYSPEVICSEQMASMAKKMFSETPKLFLNIAILTCEKRQELLIKSLFSFMKDMKISLTTLELFHELVLNIRLGQEILDAFVAICFTKCQKLQKGEQKNLHVMCLCHFVIKLTEKGYFDPSNQKEKWLEYCNEFKEIEKVDSLKAQIEKGNN